MKIYEDITHLIGKTPIMALDRFSKKVGAKARILSKIEFFNPTGSIKDRAALYMILDAERRGLLKEGSVIIEPTSGNTGIGLAAIGVSRGYRVILTMPDTMSIERRNLLSAYGAELVLTDGALGMNGAIARANELLAQIPGAWLSGQFDNPANAKAHEETTGPEIWDDTDGTVDIVVAGVGTGGTITGISKYLKQKNPSIRIVAVEPSDSAVLSGNAPGPHKLQGIGAGFVPGVLDTNAYDEIITVDSSDAYDTGKLLCKTEGLLVGVSASAVLYAATLLSKKEENAGKNIVVILPDTGMRYLSTPDYLV